MPIPSPSVSNLPRVASVNNLSPECTPTSNADAVELTITQPEPTRTESQTSTQSSFVRDDTFLENNLPLLNVPNPDKHLKIFYYNARSLDELKIVSENEPPDIFCIVETWLSNTIADNEIVLPNVYGVMVVF